MNGTSAQNSLLILSVMVGVLGLAGGIGSFFYDGTAEDPVTTAGRVSSILLGGVGGGLLLAGLWVSGRAPRVGGIMAVVGAVAVGVVLVWTIVIPVLALVAAWFGFTRARRFGKAQQQRP